MSGKRAGLGLVPRLLLDGSDHQVPGDPLVVFFFHLLKDLRREEELVLDRGSVEAPLVLIREVRRKFGYQGVSTPIPHIIESDGVLMKKVEAGSKS